MRGGVCTYRLVALSPIHVGTGKRLQSDLDFYVHPGNRVNVLDFDRLLAACEEADVNPLPHLEQGSLAPLWSHGQSQKREREVDPRLAPLLALQAPEQRRSEPQEALEISTAVAYQARLDSTERPAEILEQIKTVSGLGYLPGSSLKGAVRTALWAQMLRDELLAVKATGALATQRHSVRRERAARTAERALFGRDEHHDTGRAIRFGDSGPGAKVSIYDVRIADQNRRGRLGWKSMASRRIESRPERGTALFCECVPPGAKLSAQFTIDAYLFDGERVTAPEHNSVLQHFQAHRGRVMALERACREWAEYLIDRESGYYRQGGLGTVATFYEQTLRRELDDGSFLLPIGWGTGWLEKTAGDLLGTDLVDELRRWFTLGLLHAGCGGALTSYRGRYRCRKCRAQGVPPDEVELSRPFPKTRKIAFANGQPTYPMGWVKFVRQDSG